MGYFQNPLKFILAIMLILVSNPIRLLVDHSKLRNLGQERNCFLTPHTKHSYARVGPKKNALTRSV